MMKWIIASYIVLVFSAKAHALSTESNPALHLFNHAVKGSQELKIEDPLPDSSFETIYRMKYRSVLENFVG